MIDVYSKTFLGLTVACARCHDHKFDPITQKDFYALQGYLQSTSYRQARFETMEHNRLIALKLESLRDESGRHLWAAYEELASPVGDHLSEYLLASFDVIRTATRQVDATESEENASIDEEQHQISPSTDMIAAEAKKRDLDSVILTSWINHLLAAATDKSDYFHLWGSLCIGHIETINDFRTAVAQLEENWGEAIDSWSFNESYWNYRLIGESPGFRVLPVYQERTPSINAVRFRLSSDPEAPLAVVHLGGVCESDPAFSLVDAAGVMHESGATGAWRNPGPVLRTPTFEIQEPKVFARVRGSVNTYIAVDSHLLVKGPLHGSLVKQHKGSDGWRWIEHDVSRYTGHRAHVEFIPIEGQPFEIDTVCKTDSTPFDLPNVPFETNKLMSVDSLEQVAKLFEQELWLQPTYLPLAHPDLFGLRTTEAREHLRKVSEPWLGKRDAIVARIRQVSQTAPAMFEGSGEDEYVFIRGNWKKRGDVVPRRFLEVFDGEEVLRSEFGSGRLELAEQMVDPEQTPILPRVIVNRIWQHYFGVGLVLTPDDFGHMGRPPSHPELLDWLACELVDHDWSLKHIHRLILNSSAYRMSSASEPRPLGRGQNVAVTGENATSHAGPGADASGSDHDPQPSTLNPQLFARMPVKRLEGEIIRDSMLRLSGHLDDRMYGRSVPVHLTPFMEGRGRPSKSGPVDGAGRRSLYIAVRRNFPDPFFQAFDMPNPHTTTGRRTVSNVPAQALAMMNNPMVIELSRQWAERLLTELPDASTELRVRHAYLACVSRETLDNELTNAIDFVHQQADDLGTTPDDPRVWADLCQVLLNTKEFLFVR